MNIGVNYTPRAGWFHSWLDFDPGAVRADLAAISGLGLDHVRIFPLWTLLQPHRGLLRQRAVDQVVEVLDIAHEVGLRVWIDALNGHLSSFEFLPPWVTTWHRSNLFTDPQVRAGQRQLLAVLADAAASHPAAAGMGLGNEFSQFAATRHPDVSPTPRTAVDDWLADLFGVLGQHWPDGEHSHSYDDDLFFDDTHPFAPPHAVGFGSVTTVHSWVFAKNWGALTGDQRAYGAFARYLLELAAGWAPDPSRTLWLQEIGAPAPHISADQAPQFLRASLTASSDMPGLQGMTWWCSHDVDRGLLDFPELEYSLGLFGPDGTPKPIARELADLLPSLRTVAADAAPRPAVVFDVASDFADRSVTGPAGPVFTTWWNLWREGHNPALVWSGYADDAGLLTARGISEVLAAGR
ncbi:MAG: glycosyl hydrolase [Beutenbergiaceae bacterium]